MADNRPTPEDRREAARAVAGWYIGDASWADLIIDAYLSPSTAMRALRAEMSEGDSVDD